MIIPRFASVREHVKNIADRFRRRAVVLLYHRVGELPIDPQLLTVVNERFARHMAYLSRRYPLVTVERLAQALVTGEDFPNQCVAVTFDDGYADNLLNAKTILEQYEVSATVFVTTGYLDQEREFWWDELERIFLLPSSLPARCRIRVGEKLIEYDLAESRQYTKWEAERHRAWNVTRPDNPTARHRIYRDLCSRIRPMNQTERETTMRDLRAWSGMEMSRRDTHRSLSACQLRELASNGLVRVGAHSVSHTSLASLSLQDQRAEIQQSRDELAALVGDPVTSFAYPYGTRSDYSRTTLDLVREAGFSLGCANHPSVVTRADDPFQLPRFVVRDWSEERFSQALEGWFDGRRVTAD